MLVFCCFLLIIKLILCDECKWSTSEWDFDLSILQDSETPISCYASSGNWVMFYTPCKNELGCSATTNNTNKRYMMTHSSLDTGNCHLYLAEWEGNEFFFPKRHYDDSGTQMYTFDYTNGYKDPTGSGDGCENGRFINVTFVCDKDSKDVAYDPERVSCLKYPESQNGICFYSMNISSYLACSASNNSSGNNSLGGGWIFVIIVLVVFSLYCLIGYGINAKKNDNCGDFKNNIPNSRLWHAICCCCDQTNSKDSARILAPNE